MEINSNLAELVIVRRLVLNAQRAEDRRKGKLVEEKSAKDEMEEDRAIISGNAPIENNEVQMKIQIDKDEQINLSELFARLKEVNQNQSSKEAQNETQQVRVTMQSVVEQQASFSYTQQEKLEGLVRRSQTQAETDRYRFDFTDGSTFKITDKWSDRSTTIWGDPHVDVDDVEGDRNGEFSDLTGSDKQTTLMLKDGTRVTFTARDNGVIEAVDIFNGSQHLSGIGTASVRWNEKDGLFATMTNDGKGGSSSVPQGDIVYAGGDGNDWFAGDGKLLWGKTTGPVVTSRPDAIIHYEYRESISQQIGVQVVNKQT
jgi:hypothetical protein